MDSGTDPFLSRYKRTMEVIVREINLAYESVKKGNENGYDSSVFAEERIHSVLDLVSNKDVTNSLNQLV